MFRRKERKKEEIEKFYEGTPVFGVIKNKTEYKIYFSFDNEEKTFNHVVINTPSEKFMKKFENFNVAFNWVLTQ